tara:strand:- start:306 stop:506 length:201 start_codon:yes stop_codon:yes gene_type:complete
MVRETYLTVTGILFSLVAITHLGRVVFSLEMTLGEWVIPFSVSITAGLLTGILSVCAFHQLSDGCE